MALGNLSRSAFLEESLRAFAATAGFGLLGLPLARRAFAAPAPAKESVLVVVFLRGACDGLSLVAPLSGEDRKLYEEERPSLHQPISGPGALLPLDSRFGFHAKAKGLHRLYLEKKLAVLPATGLPANTRSHFDAQNYMELGVAEKRSGGPGWATRLLNAHAPNAEGIPSLSIGALVPMSLADYSHAMSVSDLGRLNFAVRAKPEDHQAALAAIYANGDGFAQRAGRETLRSLSFLQDALKKPTATEMEYPKSDLANRLHVLSRLLQLGLGTRVATLDMGGWDTHKQQGMGLDGVFAKQVEQLSDSLDTFERDLAQNAPAVHARTTVIVMTEFGRRLRENANHGTDHGHGGVFLAFGAGIRGGQVLGRWPGLATEKLYERADVAVANDYRQPLAEILAYRFGAKDIGTIFPGFRPGGLLGITSG